MRYKCTICLGLINIKKENWNKLQTYNKQFLNSSFYFHDLCYINYLKSKTMGENNPKFENLLQRAHGMLDNMGIDKVVEIKA